jgi:phosphate-selective porin OprO/OprP
MRIGARMQVDALFGGGDGDLHDYLKSKNQPDIEDGAEFRRARIYMQGMVTEYFEYKFQYDFADANKVKIADIWGELKKIPAVGNARVGQFYEPLSMEQLTSDFEADFGDRSVMNALSPARNIGAALHEKYGWKDGNSIWWIGGFVDDGSGDPAIATGDGDHAITARVAVAPIARDDDSLILQFGVSGSYRTPTAETVRYQSRPESHLAPFFVDTGTITGVDTVELFGVEGAFQAGPFHCSAEYLQSKLDADAVSDPTFSGWMMGAGWFLTGEHLAYNRNEGIFSGTKVSSPYGKEGWGAVELAARLSQLDLTDEGVDGGKMRDVIVGVNWLLTNNIKVMVDGVRSHVDDVGTANMLQLWFQVTL